MTLTTGNWITLGVVAASAIAGIAMFKADVISFERFTEKREGEIWKRVDAQEKEIAGLKVRVSVLEAIRKLKP